MSILARILPNSRRVSEARYAAFSNMLVVLREDIAELMRLGTYSNRFESPILEKSEQYELAQELLFLDRMLNKHVYRE